MDVFKKIKTQIIENQNNKKMKKIILTLTAIVVALLTTTAFTYANDKNPETVLNNIGSINKIEVHGNVEVYISTGAKDQVIVNNHYYAQSALVQDENGVLRISSYSTEKLIVSVSVTDLRSIAAYDNSVIKSNTRLSFIDLEVNLYNTAYAALNLDNYAASITLIDQAKANLTGTVTDYSLTYSDASTVERRELFAENVSEIRIAPKQAPKQIEKAEVVVEEDVI